MQIDRRADADGDAVDAGDDRLLRGGQREQKIPDFRAALAAHGDGHEVGEVVARRERARHARGRRGRGPPDRHRPRPSASAISAYMARVIAFFLSGRFMRMICTAPRRSTMMCSLIRYILSRRQPGPAFSPAAARLSAPPITLSFERPRLAEQVFGKEAAERDPLLRRRRPARRAPDRRAPAVSANSRR